MAKPARRSGHQIRAQVAFAGIGQDDYDPLAGKPWLGTTLTVKSSKLLQDDAGEVIRPGLPASGMFIINPPHTLKAALQLALPQMVAALKQDANASFTMESGG